MIAAARAALADAARAALSRRSLLDFCAWTDPEYDPSLPHARIICAHLDALAAREIENLAIFMPPQHGKSYHFSQRFPAYALGISGGQSLIATTSYTIDVARKNSRAARRLVEDARYPFPAIRLSATRAVDEWYTTAGGGIKAAGRGGSLTGFGANIIGIDDPFKDRREADSPTIRDEAWLWYQEVVSTRRRAQTSKMLAQTRWHDDDLAGRILNSGAAKDWTVLELRSRAEEDDPLGRPLGAVLWPGGPRPLSVEAGEISSRGYAALYQQRPLPAEGAIFKAPWFVHRYRALPSLNEAAFYLDGAWKDGVSNDRSALALWATDGIDYYLVDAWAGQLEYPDLKSKVADYWARWKGVAPVVTPCVEDAASGIPIIQELRRTTAIPIVGVTVDKAKITRAEAVSPLFESGKVRLPHPDVAAFPIDEWIDEHLRFPAGKRDDWVDTTSGALARLASPRSRLSWSKVSTARVRT